MFFQKNGIWKTTLQKSLPKKHVSRTRNFEPSTLTLDRDFRRSRWVNTLLNHTCSIVSPYPERLKRPYKLLLKNDASEKSRLKIDASNKSLLKIDASKWSICLPLNAHISAPRAPPELIPELIVPEFYALSSQNNEYIYVLYSFYRF